MAEAGVLFFRSIVRSFDVSFYKEVLHQKVSRSMLYLAGILFIATVVVMPVSAFLHDRRTREVVSLYERGLPDVYFEKGKAVYDGEMPYIYEEELGKSKIVFVVDTTGKTEEIDKKYRSGLLITRDKIIIKDRGKVGSDSIPKEIEKTKVKDYFIGRLNSSKWQNFFYSQVQIYLFNLIIVIIFVALIGGVTFLIYKYLIKRGEDFPGYFNIIAYSFTPLIFGWIIAPYIPHPVISSIVWVISFFLFCWLAYSASKRCSEIG